MAGFGHEKKGETEISPFREPKTKPKALRNPVGTFLWLLSLGSKESNKKKKVDKKFLEKMKKIILAADSFKGSLSSRQVAAAMERGIRAVFPDCAVHAVSVADGGEGTVEALVESLRGEFVTATVHDPLMRPVEARYGVVDDGRTAVIEMAAASGLPLVEPKLRNPLNTTTYGTGELIADALSRGCRRFRIGIGGSATNDAGTGMLQALGYRFFDAEGNEVGQGGRILERIARIDDRARRPELAEAAFTIACDVTNPFSGPQGAAHVFAPQKGADEAMVAELDRGLRHFAGVIEQKTGENIDGYPGAGAAGGLGGAFKAILGAEFPVRRAAAGRRSGLHRRGQAGRPDGDGQGSARGVGCRRPPRRTRGGAGRHGGGGRGVEPAGIRGGLSDPARPGDARAGHAG